MVAKQVVKSKTVKQYLFSFHVTISDEINPILSEEMFFI